MFLWLKALHVVSMVCWFAGLFYLPRLFVYHAQATDAASSATFRTMERKLYRAIMVPSMLVTLASGLYLLHVMPGYLQQGWMHLKLALVVLLIGYHHTCGAFVKKFARGDTTRSHVFYRVFNEVPVLILAGAVVMVIVRPL